MYKKIFNFLLKLNYIVEATLISLGIAGLAIILLADVFARQFFQSLYYADEITRFLIILVTFTGMSYAARNARHIRMGAILEMLPPKIEKPLMVLVASISSFTMFFLCFYSTKYLIHIKTVGQVTAVLRTPYWYFLIIPPIGFFMTGLQYLLTCFKNFTHKDVWASPVRKSEFD
jgi:TRAP-type C4-dicarboxylate transport system permease small subunit